MSRLSLFWDVYTFQKKMKTFPKVNGKDGYYIGPKSNNQINGFGYYKNSYTDREDRFGPIINSKYAPGSAWYPNKGEVEDPVYCTEIVKEKTFGYRADGRVLFSDYNKVRKIIFDDGRAEVRKKEGYKGDARQYTGTIYYPDGEVYEGKWLDGNGSKMKPGELVLNEGFCNSGCKCVIF